MRWSPQASQRNGITWHAPRESPRSHPGKEAIVDEADRPSGSSSHHSRYNAPRWTYTGTPGGITQQKRRVERCRELGIPETRTLDSGDREGTGKPTVAMLSAGLVRDRRAFLAKRGSPSSKPCGSLEGARAASTHESSPH